MILRLLLSALVLDLVLILPNHPGALTLRAFLLFPLELPVILLALAALPAPARGVRAVLALGLLVLTLQKLADLATYTAFGRGFNVAVDAHMLDAGIRLGAGTLGLPLFLAAAAGGLAVLAGFAAVLWRATGVWVGLARPQWTRPAAALAAAAALYAGAEIGWAMRAWLLPGNPPGAAFTARTGIEHARDIVIARRELAAFRRAADTDTATALAAPLAALAGRDVIVVFVESYGRASLDNPLYAPTHRPILAAAETALAQAGLAARTGWLTSPIEGGQSWLAHATLAAGLAVPDHLRHAALVASPRRTLFEIAADAGWHTAAISPAITMPWPEGARLGFRTRIDRDAMGYRGPPFNWVTMPDQFTLAQFRDRLPPDARPLFAQVTLISSHAPWVPVPVPVPWETVGDGSIFAPMAQGDPPQVVWQDPDRIRDQYRRSLAYSLTVTLDWAARQGPDGPLLLILGDHPPVGFVSGVPGRDVPAHLIGPPAVIARVDGWGWTPGLISTADTPVWPMQDWRDRFLAAFSTP
jgi:hypothetical protein